MTGVAFSADGSRIVSDGADDTVRVWDARTHRLLLTLRAGLEKVTAIALSPDGKRVAASGKGGLKIWDLPGRK